MQEKRPNGHDSPRLIAPCSFNRGAVLSTVRSNCDISLKRTAKGELVIVAPVGGENRTGDGKSKLDSVLAIHP